MIAVDTSVFMAIALNEEDSANYIKYLCDNDLCISAGTLSELYIVAAARNVLNAVETMLEGTGIKIVPVDSETARIVKEAYFRWGKGRHAAGLNFGDCFSYALAVQKNIPLLFKGNDFSQTDVVTVYQ